MHAPPRMPFDQPGPLLPPPLLRDMQAKAPIHAITTATGDPAWLVTGYPQVRALLDDDRLGRSHPDPEHASRIGRSVMFGGPRGGVESERAEHDRMRSLLRPHFAPGRLRALRGRVDALTEGLLDDLAAAGPPADLHAVLALPLPIAVICELLGVPYADRPAFRAWSQAAADTRDQARSRQGYADLVAYGMELVARKRAGGDPDADVISRLAATEGVDDQEAAELAMSLLFAGHETTVAAIGFGVLWLLATPGQWERLATDPAAIDGAVEEVLRAPRLGGNGGIPRYARTGFEVAGVRIETGDLVVLDTGAANHDGAIFADADRFDVTREGPAHLTFGQGARYCIGAPLARMELKAALTGLSARFPGLRLAVEPAGLRFEEHQLTRPLSALPVTW
ncbi:cytochrome P450 [Spongiactinospora rosea]|uniref:Cytochrome P450 n=1 Tax=Spongiactinospora rosea TaxID=2248750 RepID=A0A366LY02_9ACTN|nr:cytochrome P450 [Spongiactinospora rosea]RBQ18846.1 cytochrome P450 [Spongiactinospora rosea]